MPIETLDLDGFLKFLKQKQGQQSDRKFAKQLGVSASYLSDVYKRRTVPGESITGPLMARRKLLFEVEVPESSESRSKDSSKKSKNREEES